MTSLPPAAVFFAGALMLPLLPRRARSVACLIFPLLAFWLLLRLEAGAGLTVPFLDYELVLSRVDRLSLVFGYVFVAIAFLGAVYGFHLRDTGQQVEALLYAGSSLGVVFAGDLLTLFVFWELMAMSSVCLIWARRTLRSTRAGMRYIIVHLTGGGVLLAGILWHLDQTGSLAFNLFDPGGPAYLMLLGFALNAAIPPLHAWLSDAYPEGTVTGSVYLSAFTTKVAVYALARGFAGFEPLVWAGAVMAVYGVVFAVLQNDIRRLLAYHIISQVGYMVAAVGIGAELGVNAATAHAFAHILYKALLFMGAGTVLYATGRSKLTGLGGLARAMPLALALYMVGAFSISGVPLFSGFVSKSMVVYAAEQRHLGTVVLLLNLASVGTFLSTALKLPYFTWFGPNRAPEPAVAAPRGMYLGMALTAGVCLAIGVYPSLLYRVLPFAVNYQPYTAEHVVQTLQLLALTGFGFWLLMGKLGGEETITLDTDWFYRRPSRLAYNVCVVSLSRLFAAAEGLTLTLARASARASANPAGYLVGAMRWLSCALSGATQPNPGRSCKPFDPDRYRFPLSIMMLAVLLFFVILVVWRLLASGR